MIRALAEVRIKSITLALDRVLELTIWGGMDGKELVSESLMIMGFPSVTEW